MSSNVDLAYVEILRTESGSRRRSSSEREPDFNGRPGFLLEPDAAECYPYGVARLRDAERRLLLPAAPLHHLAHEHDETLTELATRICADLGERCSSLGSLAVVTTHGCLSEDVSTCLSSRLIDALQLDASHSFALLGELGAGFVAALECAVALRLGEDGAAATFLVAAEKWRPPFRRHFGDLFALSDGIAVALLSDRPRPLGRSMALRSWSSCSASIDAAWLTAPTAIDVGAWLGAVEAGLAHCESSCGIDLRRAAAASVTILGPTLGLGSRDLEGIAPRLASLLAHQAPMLEWPGHFGVADPLMRLGAWLDGSPAPACDVELILWSVGPGGDVGIACGRAGT